MKWFYDLKVAAKLLTGFIIVAIIAGIVGVTGIININTINNNDTSLYEENTLGLQFAGNANVFYQRIRLNTVKMLLDTESSNTYIEKINNYITQTEGFLKEYEDGIINDVDRKQFADVKNLWGQYKTLVLEAVKKVQAGDQAGAEKIVLKDVSTVESSLMELFDQLFNYNSNTAKTRSDTNTDTANSAMLIMVIIIVVGMAIAIILGLFISRTISKPVKSMVEAADKLAMGDVNVNVQATTKDEIGSLMLSFAKMVENIREQAFAAEKIATGDMTVQVKIKSDNDLLGKKLSEMVETNNEILNNINSASDQVAAGARQVSASSQALSQGSTEQASSIEEITSSMTQIAAQTKQNAVFANQANDLALAAKDNAVEGNVQMQEMVKAMKEINDSSSNISKIIKVIDDIAFQTNILALNAAVEAARAGQHGKGFAVVAEEVRNLAARSANAAKETTDMIEQSIKKVEAGTLIANNTAGALNKIVDGVAKAATLVGDIASASNEQAAGIQQINQAISQVAQVVQTNSATAEESASASEELSSQAELLKNAVSRFKLKKMKVGINLDGDFNPEVMRMLEDMMEKKKAHRHLDRLSYVNSEAAATQHAPKTTISLEDNNFGKY